MRRKMNKGVSMVEILISIAIFAVLMVPIVSGIITSLNSTTDAKTLQYRNEFAENMMEYVKQDSLANIMKGEYFASIGSFTSGGEPIVPSAKFYADPTDMQDTSLNEIKAALATQGVTPTTATTDVYYEDEMNAEIYYYPYESYRVEGKVKLGTKHETYSYAMEISNKYYADKQANTEGSYINPNNLELGIVEDIDYTKVALINGTIANYDEAVSKAFLTKKIERLKVSNPDWYEIYMQQQTSVDLFTDDTATRVITVKVSGEADEGYEVKCYLKYQDSNSLVDDYFIEYNPFNYKYPVNEDTGVATLPNIYLMYNVCLYNGQYSPNDYIAIDTTELEDDVPVNLFIVETAETYSSTLARANNDLVTMDEDGNIVSSPKLYNENYTSDAVLRQGVNIHLGAVSGSTLSNVSVYHNFDIDTVNSDSNKKNSLVRYKQDQNVFAGLSAAAGSYVPLITYTSGSNIDVANSVANFDTLNGAQEESRGLYEVKIWLEKGDTVDTTVNPIMTGTKGGDES